MRLQSPLLYGVTTALHFQKTATASPPHQKGPTSRPVLLLTAPRVAAPRVRLPLDPATHSLPRWAWTGPRIYFRHLWRRHFRRNSGKHHFASSVEGQEAVGAGRAREQHDAVDLWTDEFLYTAQVAPVHQPAGPGVPWADERRHAHKGAPPLQVCVATDCRAYCRAVTYAG